MNPLGDLKTNLPAPASEATKIEQARAFAEVITQAEMAKRFPRQLTEVCRRIKEGLEGSPALVAASKYSYPRGGEEIAGFSIDFARFLAECVGNIHYSIKELSRDEDQSEILAYAWDLETNTMQTRSIVVPHTRDTKQGKKSLTDDRDIYENNTNNGARRLRECILGVIPTGALKYAEDVVEGLLKKAFPEEKRAAAIKEMIGKFAPLGITEAMLVAERGGKKSKEWSKEDLAALHNHGRSIEMGTRTKQEIFGAPPEPKGASAATVTKQIEQKAATVETPKPGDNQPTAGKTGGDDSLF
jgi:hypothetical protein